MLQITVAFLITGSMAFAMQPPAVQPIKKFEATVTNTEIQPIETPINPQPIEQPVIEPVVQSVTAIQPEPVLTPPPYIPSGNQQQWLLESGIPQEYWRAVDYIVSHESGWRPCAYYPSGNDCSASPVNACGLVQQNPCGKIPGDWRDPVVALKWQYQYVINKYGGYPQAMQYWIQNGNY